MKLGDLVVLKSGGPEMVIEGISATSCNCCWFDDEYHVIRETFQLTSIEPSLPDEADFVTHFTA